MNNNQQLCTFVVSGKNYSVPVDAVQEVLAEHQITDIPLAPHAVIGLMNIRGHIVPAIALNKVLGVADGVASEDSINIIVNHRDEKVGLMADEIGDIVEVSPDDIEPPPETINDKQRRFMSGVFPVDGALYLLLDLEALLQDRLCSKSVGRSGSGVLQ